MRSGVRRLLGEELVASGAISEGQLVSAIERQKTSGGRLGEILVEQGVVSVVAVLEALGRTLGVPSARIRHGLFDPALLSLIDPEELAALNAMPLFRVRGELSLAMSDPLNLQTIDRVEELTGLRVRPVLALEADIAEFSRREEAGREQIDRFLSELEDSEVTVIDGEKAEEHGFAILEAGGDASPVVNLVNLAITTAIRDGASDIHIEASENGTRIRYRIDGAMRHLLSAPSGLHAAIVSRVKVIGRMDIAQKRLPQEGRVRISFEKRAVDLRVSSIPTLLGEKIVIRLLDKDNLEMRMDRLGIRLDALDRFVRAIKQPHGLVLVTGPTGSGKTTTLYSALDMLRGPDVNVVTVEDPVEYQLEMLNQIQVNDSINLTFARALRSILRQDPDIIMVGEVRDPETARVAVQAALTGHLVLATVHTNDCASTIARIGDMGVEPYLTASAIKGIVAQRLARTNCSECSVSYFPVETVIADADLTPEQAKQPFYRGDGCPRCHDTGYRGRLGVYEVVEISPLISRAIYERASTQRIRAAIKRTGVLSLREEAVRHALDGRISLEEALRVTQRDEWEDGPVTAAPAGDTADEQGIES
ncbi:MAG: ATPase, T2SS/T4P/T4SS family [Planctomycetota bacterium]